MHWERDRCWPESERTISHDWAVILRLRRGDMGPRAVRLVAVLVWVPLFAGCNAADDGDPATWRIDGDALTSESTGFEARVTRVGCSGGVTGRVFDPQVSLGSEVVTVRFDVESIGDGPQLCPGNDEVAVVVDLGEPLGDRRLEDGACSAGNESLSSACDDDGIRWSPPPPPIECELPDVPAIGLDIAQVPTPPVAAGAEGRDEFGASVVDALQPMILGADAGKVVATLRGSGWTVTVVDDPATTTTATPDLLWNRLVVTVCNGRLEAVAFD